MYRQKEQDPLNLSAFEMVLLAQYLPVVGAGCEPGIMETLH